jgi:hypothetical protein
MTLPRTYESRLAFALCAAEAAWIGLIVWAVIGLVTR